LDGHSLNVYRAAPLLYPKSQSEVLITALNDRPTLRLRRTASYALCWLSTACTAVHDVLNQNTAGERTMQTPLPIRWCQAPLKLPTYAKHYTLRSAHDAHTNPLLRGAAAPFLGPLCGDSRRAAAATRSSGRFCRHHPNFMNVPHHQMGHEIHAIQLLSAVPSMLTTCSVPNSTSCPAFKARKLQLQYFLFNWLTSKSTRHSSAQDLHPTLTCPSLRRTHHVDNSWTLCEARTVSLSTTRLSRPSTASVLC
jgi:hypothetical protein